MGLPRRPVRSAPPPLPAGPTRSRGALPTRQQGSRSSGAPWIIAAVLAAALLGVGLWALKGGSSGGSVLNAITNYDPMNDLAARVEKADLAIRENWKGRDLPRYVADRDALGTVLLQEGSRQGLALPPRTRPEIDAEVDKRTAEKRKGESLFARLVSLGFDPALPESLYPAAEQLTESEQERFYGSAERLLESWIMAAAMEKKSEREAASDALRSQWERLCRMPAGRESPAERAEAARLGRERALQKQTADSARDTKRAAWIKAIRSLAGTYVSPDGKYRITLRTSRSVRSAEELGEDLWADADGRLLLDGKTGVDSGLCEHSTEIDAAGHGRWWARLETGDVLAFEFPNTPEKKIIVKWDPPPGRGGSDGEYRFDPKAAPPRRGDADPGKPYDPWSDPGLKGEDSEGAKRRKGGPK